MRLNQLSAVSLVTICLLSVACDQLFGNVDVPPDAFHGSEDLVSDNDGQNDLPGNDGRDGQDGVDGAQGPQGSQGQSGADGQNGQDGADGPQGQPGADGQHGQDGADGPQGPAGDPGADGPQGQPGADGQHGQDGADGPQGQPGADGQDGQDGADGQDGQDGADGQDGQDGQDGVNGEDGQDGADGENGADGQDAPPQCLEDADCAVDPECSGDSAQVYRYNGRCLNSHCAIIAFVTTCNDGELCEQSDNGPECVVQPTDIDEDGFLSDVDCDDLDPNVHPGATEVCDDRNVDENCDGLSDDNDQNVDQNSMREFYLDSDGDGDGDPTQSVSACDAPEFHVELGNDCDDADDEVSPLAQEVCDNKDNDCDGQIDEDVTVDYWPDGDGDGWGNPVGAIVRACDGSQPPNHVANALDCDDADPQVNPVAQEVCNKVDDDCDGDVDDQDDSVDQESMFTWYPDLDGDLSGNSENSMLACAQPFFHIAIGGDCDDNDPNVHPNATEVCDDLNIDEDCNGLSDDNDPDVDEATFGVSSPDEDEDGWGDASVQDFSCNLPDGNVWKSLDCDDNNDAINPDGVEICDQRDNNCDGQIDENVQSSWYLDADGDGWGDPTDKVFACNQPQGRVSGQFNGDCNDADPAINPGATEVCDDLNVDENCNNVADNADPGVDPQTYNTFWKDSDGDGFGDPAMPVLYCDLFDGVKDNDLDCDDTLAYVNPDGVEACGNALDDDCHGGFDGADAQGCFEIGDYLDGELVIDVTAPDFNVQDTCVGNTDLTIDNAQSPMIDGIATCQFQGALAGLLPGDHVFDVTGNVRQDFSADGLLNGALIRPPDNWAGAFADSETLEGTFDGQTDLNGLQLDYDGNFSVELSP